MEEENLFDTGLLKELGDKKSILIVLTFFLDNSPKDIRDLEKSISEKDLKAIFNKAHKMKGSLAMLKAIKMVAILEQIEIASGMEKDLEKVETLLPEFFKKFSLLEQQLSKEVASLKAEMG